MPVPTSPSRRRALGLAVGAAAALGAAAPASAAIEITSPAPGAIAVATTAGDTVAIDCADGTVRVSGKPAGIACAALERLDVVGDALPNRIDLQRVGPEFPSLVDCGVDGRDGDDTIVGSPGRDWLRGGAGRDAVDGAAGDDLVYVYLGGGGDTVSGGAGTDSVAVFGGGGPDTVGVLADGRRLLVTRRSATPETTVLDGPVEQLGLHGLGGDDQLSGPQDATMLDHLFVDGNDGDDTLVGGDGSDDIHGGPGDDRIDGDDGDDVVLAGEGDDTLVWRTGGELDVLVGGAGIDTATAIGGRGDDRWTVKPNGSSARLDAEGAVPSGLEGEHVERLEADAGAGGDVITGSPGLAGRIELSQRGGAGDDVLTGGDGDDRQEGGPGLDLLIGADGADTIDAGDDARDRVECGAGPDRALVDPFDIRSDCETLGGRAG
jgi:Ca2+-binding RTX toxin-like protein